MTLIIGSSFHDPLSVELFDLILPPSLSPPEHLDAASYHPLPEISHTFRPDHKVPPRFISAFSTGLVGTPWVILLTLVSVFPLHCLRWSVLTTINNSGLKLPLAQHTFFLSTFCHSFFVSALSKVYYTGTGSISNSVKSSFTVQFSPSPLFLLGKPLWQASAVVVLAEIDNWVMQR